MRTRHVRVWKGSGSGSREREVVTVISSSVVGSDPIPCLAVEREEVWGCGAWVGREGRGGVDG